MRITQAHLGFAVRRDRQTSKRTFARHARYRALVKETDDLAGDVLSPRLLVVHDASGGGEDDVAELTGRQELDNPLLEVTELHVVAWADDTGLVEAAYYISVQDHHNE